MYTATPVSQIKDEKTQKSGVSLFIKREYMNHPLISGNKWWKLKYNIIQAQQENHNKLLTFGGAYSNHIYSTAAAARIAGLKSIGIIRGEKVTPLNYILSFAQEQGMELHFIDRENYRKKTELHFIKGLRKKFGHFYLIPEGGTNELAIKGCEEFAKKLCDEVEFDYLLVPVGTGGTIAGLINVIKEKKIIGFSSLKGGAFLYNEVRKRIATDPMNWSIETRYHFGGYGKIPKELTKFITQFEIEHKIPLDPIYTGKMMYGIYDMLQQNAFDRNSRVLAIHTGGIVNRPN